jgi:hypothetical protein
MTSCFSDFEGGIFQPGCTEMSVGACAAGAAPKSSERAAHRYFAARFGNAEASANHG